MAFFKQNQDNCQDIQAQENSTLSPIQTLTQPAGYQCCFLEPPPSVLQVECPLCLMIVREPHQVTCCGKKFCRLCIERVSTQGKPCPTCNEKELTHFLDKGLLLTLNSFSVKCKHSKYGCNWTGELKNVDSHLNSAPTLEEQLKGCLYVDIPCQYCNTKLQRNDIDAHQKEICLKRPFTCEYCKDFKSDYEDVTASHWLMCDSKPVNCPNECGISVERQDIKSHTTQVCPLELVNCDFSHVGCDATLQRRNNPAHLNDSVQAHMHLLSASHSRQQSLITDQEACIKQLKLNLDANTTKIAEQEGIVKQLMSEKKTPLSKYDWTPIALTKVGATSLRDPKCFEFAIPAIIPSTCEEVLVYTYIYAGHAINTKGAQHIKLSVTSKTNCQNEKFLAIFGYPQSAINTNSENMWFSMPENRTIYLHVPMDFGANCHCEVYVIGYR